MVLLEKRDRQVPQEARDRQGPMEMQESKESRDKKVPLDEEDPKEVRVDLRLPEAMESRAGRENRAIRDQGAAQGAMDKRDPEVRQVPQEKTLLTVLALAKAEDGGLRFRDPKL